MKRGASIAKRCASRDPAHHAARVFHKQPGERSNYPGAPEKRESKKSALARIQPGKQQCCQQQGQKQGPACRQPVAMIINILSYRHTIIVMAPATVTTSFGMAFVTVPALPATSHGFAFIRLHPGHSQFLVIFPACQVAQLRWQHIGKTVRGRPC